MWNDQHAPIPVLTIQGMIMINDIAVGRVNPAPQAKRRFRRQNLASVFARSGNKQSLGTYRHLLGNGFFIRHSALSGSSVFGTRIGQNGRLLLQGHSLQKWVVTSA